MHRKSIPPKISVIIPVYNAEKHLRKTLDSILKQTIDNFEVIMVNDASKDSSLRILEEYNNKFTMSMIVNLETNQGVSNARNVGIRKAKGEFLSFIDSDDLIDHNFLNEMYNNAISNNTDIVCCNYYYLWENNLKRKNFLSFPNGVYGGRNLLKVLLTDVRIHFFVWNKIWKRDLIEKNKIYFYNKCFEDILFSVKAFYYSVNISIYNQPLYYYLKSQSSLTYFMSLDQIEEYIQSLYDLKCFLEERGIYKVYRFRFAFLGLRFVLSCLYRLPCIYIKSKLKLNIFKIFSIISKTIFYLIIDNSKYFKSIIKLFPNKKFTLSSCKYK